MRHILIRLGPGQHVGNVGPEFFPMAFGLFSFFLV